MAVIKNGHIFTVYANNRNAYPDYAHKQYFST